MYRASVFYFFALFLLAIAGFWPSYFAAPKFEADWHVHLHGVAMFLWALLLIAQAGLIRGRQSALHRGVGKVSYGLAPVIVVSTLLLAHYRMKDGLNEELLYFFYVQLSLLAVFVLAYSLAIANRHQPAVHARFIVCTALTLIDPIVARLLSTHFGIEQPLMQVMTYALIDAIFLALIAWDWKAQSLRKGTPAFRCLDQWKSWLVVASVPRSALKSSNRRARMCTTRPSRCTSPATARSREPRSSFLWRSATSFHTIRFT